MDLAPCARAGCTLMRRIRQACLPCGCGGALAGCSAAPKHGAGSMGLGARGWERGTESTESTGLEAWGWKHRAGALALARSLSLSLSLPLSLSPSLRGSGLVGGWGRSQQRVVPLSSWLMSKGFNQSEVRVDFILWTRRQGGFCTAPAHAECSTVQCRLCALFHLFPPSSPNLCPSQPLLQARMCRPSPFASLW